MTTRSDQKDIFHVMRNIGNITYLGILSSLAILERFSISFSSMTQLMFSNISTSRSILTSSSPSRQRATNWSNLPLSALSLWHRLFLIKLTAAMIGIRCPHQCKTDYHEPKRVKTLILYVGLFSRSMSTQVSAF